MAMIISTKDDLENEAVKDLDAAGLKATELNSRIPTTVDKILTDEMMNLSVKDRNDIQEEIHGVKCLAIEETPELLETALSQLAYQLDEVIPDSQKQAYLQSQQPSKDIPEHQRILQELHQLEPLPQSSYVNDTDFRLRFLRCELFDIKKAAKRMIQFLESALDLFGDYALRRPIRISDFTKEETRFMRKGRFQILPNRDRSGRRIVAMLPEQEQHQHQYPPLIKSKILLYQSWALGYKDVESQRKGHVFLVWYDHTAQSLTRKKMVYSFDALKSTRVGAVHVCSPDTPYFRIRRSIAVIQAGPENRSKLQVHLGESVELQYALQGYGIPAEDIPISWTGKIKNKNLVQWMRVREAIEEYDEYNDYNSESETQSPTSPSGIVECPQPYDVLFRKGNSYVSHPGNVKLRTMIDDNSQGDIMKRPKQLADDIFEERKRQRTESITKDSGKIGRYLIWNIQKNWWNEINDKEQICMKFEYIIREHRKSKESAMRSHRQGQKRNNRYTTANNSSTESSTNTVMLHSATTMFRSQDGDTNNGSRFYKKQRKQSSIFDLADPKLQQQSSCSEDDSTYCSEGGLAYCFGAGFSNCTI